MVDFHSHYSDELQAALLDSKRFQRRIAVNGLTLTGACPVCGDQTTMVVPSTVSTIPTAGTLAAAQASTRAALPLSKEFGYVTSAQATDPYEVDLFCSCAVTHDTKGGKSGCGAWARLLITPPGSNHQADEADLDAGGPA